MADMRAGVWQNLPGAWYYDTYVGNWNDPDTMHYIGGSDQRYDTQQEALAAACEHLESLYDAELDTASYRIYH